MPEHNIIISVDEYSELVKKSERIAAVERMMNRADFVSNEDIYAVLGIGKKVNADG